MSNNVLAQFSNINLSAVPEKLDSILNANRKQLNTLLTQPSFNWDNLLAPIEEMDDQLSQFWSPISHLNAVVNSPELRGVYHQCLPKLSEYASEIGQNETFFNAIKSIADSDAFQQLDKAQQQVIHHALRDFKLAGVALSPENKKQFRELVKQLSQLTTQFEDNVLDASQGWVKHITDQSELSGIPEHGIRTAAEVAKQKNKSGWIFTLEIPSYLAVIMHADSRALRETMYRAYTTRASDQGPNAGHWDNSQVMQNILQKRLSLAQLLNFNNYAERSLATKMVRQTQHVLDFLQKLVDASLSRAREEYQALKAYAQSELGLETLAAWDISYVSEKLREQRYNISEEELRPYFPLPKVLSGLFQIVKQLFNINIKPVDGFDRWHDDVRCYAVYNSDDSLIAHFYLDLYARENKRGGAWMDDCRIRRKRLSGDIQTPIAFLTCNFSAPINDASALLTHSEVVTLFHEFGHSLQHMLTKIDYADVSGINGIPWDAVEVASQFLENWAWEKESIALISEHYKTHEPLPDELYQRMHRAKNFQAAMMMLRQLEFSLFDFKLHLAFDPKQSNQVQKTLDEIRNTLSVIPVPEFNRFQHSFSHIFAGGYAAGYYSYKWAEVMAADAFSLFKEKGIFDRSTSQKFLETILASGGAYEPLELFIAFRGREPKIDALLKQEGIQQSA